jgi:hypothetical protein
LLKLTLKRLILALLGAACPAALAAEGNGPDHVSITWMSVTNILYELGPLHILTDGYITRIPREEFYGGGGGYAFTRHPHRPDAAAVARVLDALGGPTTISLLLTGHSHWDHSFDTATWSQLTGAPIIGSKTTCLEAIAQGFRRIAARRSSAVKSWRRAKASPCASCAGTTAATPTRTPSSITRSSCAGPPTPDGTDRRLARRASAEDFPNGGGNRAFLFTVDSPKGRYTWFYQNSASPSDLSVNIIMDGTDYGAPLENLKAAMRDAGVEHVDLWIGTGGIAIAKLLEPVLKPKAYLPVHWDDFFSPFERGVTTPYADAELEAFLAQAKIKLIKPQQYMDKWRLDPTGIEPEGNDDVKRSLGFSDRGTASR